MSQENVDKTNAYMAAYNRRDFDEAVKDFHPQVDFILPERQGYDSCHGVKQILQFWDGLEETFENLQLAPQETVDAGDRVATRLRHRARGKESGVELDEELYHQVITFEDGLMVRMDYFETWEEALAAAHAEPDAAGDDVEIVRELIDVNRSGDIEASLAATLRLCAPEVEFRSVVTAVEGASYKGLDGVRRYLEDMSETFQEWVNEIVAIEEIAPGAVYTQIQFRGTGRDSGAEVERLSSIVMLLSGGKVVSVHSYPTRAEALAAAGLAE